MSSGFLSKWILNKLQLLRSVFRLFAFAIFPRSTLGGPAIMAYLEKSPHFFARMILITLVAILFSLTLQLTQTFVAGDMYIIEAETSQFATRVENPEDSEIFLTGAHIVVGNDLVTTQAEGNTSTDCFTGYLTPAVGSVMQFSVVDGLQTLSLRRSSVPRQVNEIHGYLDITEPTWIGSAKNVRQDEALEDTRLALEGPTTITAVPECSSVGKETDGSIPIGFVPKEEPFLISGVGYLGWNNGAAVGLRTPTNPEPVAISGIIETNIRAQVCWRALLLMRCERVFTSGVQTFIPPGVSLKAVEGRLFAKKTAPLIGQVYFEDGAYKATVMTEARKIEFSSLRLGSNRAIINELRVPWFQRIGNEPVLALLFALFLGFLGVFFSIMQIGNISLRLAKEPNQEVPEKLDVTLNQSLDK